MQKQLVAQYRWMFCLLLLVWISRTSIAHLQDESAENYNDRESAEDDVREKHKDDFDERQHSLKRLLHEQLEHVTHEEQVEESQHEHVSKHDSKERQSDVNDDDESDEEVREYNPWQDSFQDIYEDGTYAYGYSLPNGVTHYERSFYSDKYKGRVVQGFYTQARFFGKRTLYELRCYHADYYSGYKPLKVQYLRRQPIVRRDEEPNVDCFDKQ